MGATRVKPEETKFQAITSLARGVRDLQQQAWRQYRPVVDQILRTGSRKNLCIPRIELRRRQWEECPKFQRPLLAGT
jgi:hypothetical protein